MGDRLLDGSESKSEIGQCAGFLRSGRRCQRDVVEGQSFCLRCGGIPSVVRESNMRRLVELQTKSIDVLEEIFLAGDDKTRLSAVIAVLDRSGLGPKSTLEVSQGVEDLTQLSREQLATRAEETLARLRSMRPISENTTEENDTTHRVTH